MSFVRVKARKKADGTVSYHVTVVRTQPKRSEKIVYSSSSKRDADKAKRRIEVDLQQERAGIRDRDPTVEEVGAAYVASLEGRSSQGAVRRGFELHINPRLGAMKLSQLSADDVDAWLDEVSASFGTQTLVHWRGYLKSAINHARRTKAWRGDNPIDVALMKKRRIRKVIHDLPTPHEVDETLKHLSTEWQLLFGFMWETGCRPGEAIGLKKEDVHLVDRWVHIRRSHDRERPKDGDERQVPLTDQCAAYLKEALARWTSSEWVFPAKDGGMREWEDTKLSRRWRVGMARAGFARGWKHVCRRGWGGERCTHVEVAEDNEQRRCPKCEMILWPSPILRACSAYDLRHARITQLVDAGIPEAVIIEMVGHFDMRFTRRHYVHLSREQLLRQLSAVGQAEKTGDTNVEPGWNGTIHRVK